MPPPPTPARPPPPAPAAPAPQRTKVLVTKDDGIRPGTTKEKLAKIRAAFPQWGNGATTGGNASQITDGVAGVLLMTRRKAEELGLEILGKHVATSVAGLAPRIMGIVSSSPPLCFQTGPPPCLFRRGFPCRRSGRDQHDKWQLRPPYRVRTDPPSPFFCTRSRQGPAFAIPKVLERCNISKEDVDLFEVNEAFASMYSYMIDIYGLPLDRTNVNGGAIALGHPLGCSEFLLPPFPLFSFFWPERIACRSALDDLEQPY